MAGMSSRRAAAWNLGGQTPPENAVVTRIAQWIAEADRLDDLQRQWQSMETSLFAKAAAQGKDCSKVVAGKSAEARAMRALDNQIAAGFQSLTDEAADILAIKSATPVAALAKIELGLRAQGPYDWREHAYELISAGIDELRAMLRTGELRDQVDP